MAPLDEANWSLVPRSARRELERYILTGTPPASPALIAVLSNNLHDALVFWSAAELTELVNFMRGYVPPQAWGSGEAIAEWERQGGLSHNLAPAQ